MPAVTGDEDLVPEDVTRGPGRTLSSLIHPWSHFQPQLPGAGFPPWEPLGGQRGFLGFQPCCGVCLEAEVVCQAAQHRHDDEHHLVNRESKGDKINVRV